MANSIEVLSMKVDALIEAQQQSMNKTDKLTEAVTALVTSSLHFEKLRAEDNHRMDKIEASIKELRKDVFEKFNSVEEKVQENTSRLDKSESSLTLVKAGTGAILLAIVAALMNLILG